MKLLSFALAGVALLSAGCVALKSRQPRWGVQADGSELRPAIVEAPISENNRAISSLDDTARFFAGRPGSPDSPWNQFRSSPGWQRHSANLDELWRRYNSLRAAPIESWASAELGGLRSPGALFYPFSGPDYLFAHAFFPGASTYLLCGLEPCDPLPPLERLNDEEVQAGLDGLYTSLTSSLNFSFFITKDMKVDLQRTAFRGTVPIMLAFLARTGANVQSLDHVALLADGSVVPAGTEGSTTPGVHVRFNGGKQLYYFTTNLANDGFKPNSRYANFVRRLAPSVAFTKSASFLMHESYFSNIRDFLLSETRAVLQDDSGIPLRDFTAAGWDVTHYGNYSGVLDIFTKYEQADLAAAHAAGTAAPLGFGIGYKHREGQSVMLLGRRR